MSAVKKVSASGTLQLIGTPKPNLVVIRNTDLGYQECYQNPLCYQECYQNLEPLGHLESLQESEIENLTILQGVDSSEVKGVLPRKREVRPVGIEPTTLDLGNRH